MRSTVIPGPVGRTGTSGGRSGRTVPAAAAQVVAVVGMPPWQPNTAYTAGQQVVSPSGDVVAAYNTHTSGATFDPNVWYADLGHLIACFTGNGTNGEKLSFFYSPDGRTVFGNGGNPAYVDPNTGASLRDPCLMKIGDTFYVTYTVNNGLSKNFAIIAGKSLANMSQIALIDCSALPDIKQVWAPEFVLDAGNPFRPYIFFTKVNAAGTNGSMYWVQATNDALTAWTALVRMAWTLEPAHYIDGSFIQVNGTWYLFYSIGSDIYRASSSSLTGTYTTDRGTANWAGWGTGIEGPEIVQYGPSKYRIYLDRFQSGLGYAYSESTDLNTWTPASGLTIAPGALPPGGLLRHGSFYKIPDQATLDAVLAQLAQPSIDPRTVYGPGAYNQGTTGLVTAAAVAPAGATPTAGSNNDLMVSADGAGKFTFREAGLYEIYGTFAVTAGSGVTRSFAELATGAGGSLARTPGSAEDSFQLVIPSYRAAAGEQILIRTFLAFTGGGSATINATIRFSRRSR